MLWRKFYMGCRGLTSGKVSRFKDSSINSLMRRTSGLTGFDCRYIVRVLRISGFYSFRVKPCRLTASHSSTGFSNRNSSMDASSSRGASS